MANLTEHYYYDSTVITPATLLHRVYHANEVDKVIARHQYLRCLVIAQWCSCKSKVYDLYARHTDYMPNVQKYRRKRDHYADRFKKLLVLAEKFKEP